MSKNALRSKKTPVAAGEVCTKRESRVSALESRGVKTGSDLIDLNLAAIFDAADGSLTPSTAAAISRLSANAIRVLEIRARFGQIVARSGQKELVFGARK